jgi:hypothetical protein
LQCAFPLDVLMVPSSVLTVDAGGARLSCGGFSLGETILFGSLEYSTDHFGGLSLSPMGSTRGGPPSSQRTMTGDSTEGFPRAPDEEGRIDLFSPRRHDTRAQPCPYHDHTMAKEPFDRSSYSNYSTPVGDTMVGHQPPPRATVHLSGDCTTAE